MKKKIIGISVCMLLIIATGVTVVGTIEKNNEPKSMENTNDELIVIWDEPPDTDIYGVNICCDQINSIRRVIADDFLCRSLGFLVEIHLFGSWKQDFKGYIEKFNLTIYSDIPADESEWEYSMPNKSLWSYEADELHFTETPYISFPMDTWWDPYTDDISWDTEIYEYTITIPDDKAFLQRGTVAKPVMYWLAVHVVVDLGEGGRFGLRSTAHIYDDSVMYNYTKPPFYWDDLHYPIGVPGHSTLDSIDFAFKILAKEWIVPPFDVVVPRILDIGLFGVYIELINTGNETIDILPWDILTTGTSGLIPPTCSTTSGVVKNLGPGETTTIKTNPVIGLGSFEIMMTVPGSNPIIFKSFILLFLVINKIWLNPT